jgi:hypothetical protein
MSWSVSASGKSDVVKAELEKQFANPLAEGSAGLADEGEKETVRRIRETIWQTLETFGPDKTVTVSAYGHIGWENYDTRAGCYQNVSLKIEP